MQNDFVMQPIIENEFKKMNMNEDMEELNKLPKDMEPKAKVHMFIIDDSDKTEGKPQLGSFFENIQKHMRNAMKNAMSGFGIMASMNPFSTNKNILDNDKGMSKMYSSSSSYVFDSSKNNGDKPKIRSQMKRQIIEKGIDGNTKIDRTFEESQHGYKAKREQSLKIDGKGHVTPLEDKKSVEKI